MYFMKLELQLMPNNDTEYAEGRKTLGNKMDKNHLPFGEKKSHVFCGKLLYLIVFFFCDVWRKKIEVKKANKSTLNG